MANHLVVDAVSAVFPFRTAPFVRLRERFWLDVFAEAAQTETSLIFTFAPEPTVDGGFPQRARTIVAEAGGSTLFVALDVAADVQEQRLVSADRAAFGKMTSLPLLQSLRNDFARCFAEMPPADLTIDTTRTAPPGGRARDRTTNGRLGWEADVRIHPRNGRLPDRRKLTSEGAVAWTAEWSVGAQRRSAIRSPDATAIHAAR